MGCGSRDGGCISGTLFSFYDHAQIIGVFIVSLKLDPVANNGSVADARGVCVCGGGGDRVPFRK